MLLFLISFLLVFVSSYMLVSIIAPKKSVLGIIYLFLIAFSQIVLTFEILSLFTAINQICVLASNIIFTCGATFFWNKNSRPLWNLEVKDFRNRFNNSLKLDKSLMWLYVGFLVFVIVAIILNAILPITNSDAQAYHCARSLFWVLQGSLNHFVTADIRNLCLPINSEILYAWVILFLKTDAFLGFFSFVGYLLAIISIYNIMGFMGFCVRKRLWVIFILSSFSSVIVQISGTETDIIIAGLATSCIFLFWYGLKNNKKTPIFMASLAYALAIGTKTTALIAIPGVGLILTALCFNYKKFKPFGLFLMFGALNFFIFSSYNYILNIIDYHNISGPVSFMVVSKNYYGIKGMFANFIKYFFMFVDVTGFTWSKYLAPIVIATRNNILNFLHLGYIQDGLYSTPFDVNNMLLEPLMGAGVLGLVVFIPNLLWALIKPLFKRKSKKTLLVGLFALAFIVNLLSISYLLAYMAYSVRFIMSFMVISSPILAYSYLSKKNPLKYIIVFFALFYLICVSTHLWPRPFAKISRAFIYKHSTLTQVRYLARCKDFDVIPEYSNSACPLAEKIQTKIPNTKKILAFISSSDSIFILKALEFQGYKIDLALLEDVNKIDFKNYDYVITPSMAQIATDIKYYEKRKNECKINGHSITSETNNLTPCIYQKNLKIQNAKNKEAQYPFQSYCGLSKDYISNKNLEPIIITGLIRTKMGEFNYYIIYQNTKVKKP